MTFGISTALLTPFHADGRIDVALLSAHAHHVLGRGTQGVTLFGTTGEGASIDLQERQDVTAALIHSGVPASQITIGLCASAIGDVLAQIELGCAAGVTRFLLLPPFYFNPVSTEGLFAWHAKVFEAADPAAQFILYHIPQVTHVPLTFDLIIALMAAYGDRIIALKDSAGQWDDTRYLLESGKIPVLVGDERLLHRAAAMGAIGSICGMANLMPERTRRLLDTQTEDIALSELVDQIVSVPVIPALKAALVAQTGNPQWGHVRAPLVPLPLETQAAIAANYRPKTVNQ